MDSKYIVEVAPAQPATGNNPYSYGPTYRYSGSKDGFPTIPGVTNLYENFTRSVEKYPLNKAFGWRGKVDGKAGPFKWMSYADAGKEVDKIGSALNHIGLKPGMKGGIYGINSVEWMLAMQAYNSQSVFCVPLYDTLGENAVEYILNHAEVAIVFFQAEKAAKLFEALPNAKTVKTVVSFGDLSLEFKEKAASFGMTAYSQAEFRELGAANPAKPVPPQGSNLCTIMYTSGTTGDPKGVEITHSAILSSIAAGALYLKDANYELTEHDKFLSYLPLAHIMDRVLEEMFIYLGASIGYWQGDVKLLVDDIGELKPTLFAGAPRIFDRIYSGIKAKVNESGGLKKWLFNFGFDRKLKSLQAGKRFDQAAPIMDALVFGKVKQRLGGNVRLILSGAAPLAPHVEDFLKVTMCAPVVQGYGLTENCAGGCIAIPNVASMASTVGPPQPQQEVRLAAVPEMNYDPNGTPARGEVCFRGPALFSGYYKQPELYSEVVVDGWFHTGDIGEWQPNGALKLIDRKKNIFKLSQGEYVAVENLENVYGQNTLINQIWVYGNSFEPYLIAVVVPNEVNLITWAKANGVDGDFATIVKDPKATKYVLGELTKTGKAAKLKGFEIVKGVHLEGEEFSVDKDLITPSFKKKRPQLLKHYKTYIDALYEELKKTQTS
ncbi:Long-Chain Acyl-CoA Synthetase [Klebsormidium nitens]|uniref:Long-chain-fatty-acid--CoA ligase n=1 Tax=Klebsormidium nitens TaxID=105231 RepID=A0A1Y1I2W3_KLENI|nr:Long-Chain Acyl-CoA Synthetase [Klebsormidium nitens]|eukprot:GAQ85275.1 Long-Chain Acyl-CoA Synthetase [Klebsormidium nitens]